MRLVNILCLIFAVISGWTAEETYAGFTGRWVEVVASAYSPQDPIDGEYRASKGEKWRWIAADGKTDVRESPYGIAVANQGGKPWMPYGTQIIVPSGYGYLDGSRPVERVFTVDDTGSMISRRTKATGTPHIDLRYMHSSWATKWGSKSIRVFVVTGRAPVADESFKDDPFYDPYR